MRFRLAVLMMTVALLGACGGKAVLNQAPTVSDTASAAGIEVNGVGVVLGAPDTMTVTIGVQVTRETVAEATEVAASKASALIGALESAGVDDRDVQTANFSIYPQYDYSARGQRLVGFTVVNSVVANLRAIDEAGSTIDAAVAAGGDETIVQGIGFSVEDDAARLEAARAAAWSDARAKAQQLADLAGVELGAAIRIRESVQYSSFDGRGSTDADTGGTTPIAPGQLTSTVQLDVVYAIDGGG
jgi:uncharacterized protein YggE